MFLLTSFTILSTVNVEASGNTITVDDEGDGDYTSIQTAVDAASSGDTILVYSGEYGSVNIIEKQIILTGLSEELGSGNDEGRPIVNANGGAEAFHLTEASSSTIENFKIINSGADGIWLSSSSVYIQDNLFQGNNVGIGFFDSAGSSIERNIFTNNGFGVAIYMMGSGSNSFVHNDFIESDEYHALGNSVDTNQWDENYWDDYLGEDNNNDGIGDTPYDIESDDYDNSPLMSPYNYNGNLPPETPSVTGTQSGKTGNEYTYTASTTDPDGDTIEYYFDWDDGTNSGWQSSNKAKHTWNSDDTYTVKVKAKDSHGLESDWGTLEVTMPKTSNSIIDILENMLDNFDWPFPMLRVMLWGLGK